MPISLHAATVPSMLQMLGAGRQWLEKAGAAPLSEQQLIEARLAPDMLPFCYQVKSMAHHSEGAFAGVRNGVFLPDMSEPPQSIAGLGKRLDEAMVYLGTLTEDEVEAMGSKPMRFQYGDFRMDFTGEDFLLSMSQPNFYFHATTAYAILRANGVALGKVDYMGAVRTLPR